MQPFRLASLWKTPCGTPLKRQKTTGALGTVCPGVVRDGEGGRGGEAIAREGGAAGRA